METIVYLVISLLFFIFLVYIASLIFRIKELNKHLRAQTNLLAAIAEKQGIDREFVLKIMSKAEDKHDVKNQIMELPSEHD